MKGYQHLGFVLSDRSREQLADGLQSWQGRSSQCTAMLVAHIAEFDARGFYRDEGFESMYRYCVGRLHMCEQSALKRIFAARAARRFPQLFLALAEGRLHLSAVVMLSAHLTPENFERLIAAATHRTRAQIEQLLADLKPKPDLPERIVAFAQPQVVARAQSELSPGKVETSPPTVGRGFELAPAGGAASSNAPSAAPASPAIAPLSPGKVATPNERGRVAPLGLERYALQTTVSKSTYDKLQHAKNLLAHQVPGGDLATVLDRALDALIAKLEKQKFAATEKPRASQPKNSRPVAARPRTNSRHIPAAVRRAVARRDGGRCTHTSPDGRRCEARARLEFDHIVPFAKGGEATEANIRQRCRAHNQFEAERSYGSEFMREKRRSASVERVSSPNRAALPPPAC